MLTQYFVILTVKISDLLTMFHLNFFEIQGNIMNLIEQSIAAMVARGNHLLHQKVLDQCVNCQGTFI